MATLPQDENVPQQQSMESVQDEEDMYPAKDLMQAKYDLLKPTNMTDYTANLWEMIHDSDDIPPEFTEKREQVLATLQKLEEESQKVLSVLEDQEVVSALRQDKTQNLQYLKEHHGITLEDVNVLYTFENGREALCELFFSPAYINSIQTSSPWIIRYLTAAAVTSHLRKRNTNNYQKQIRELVRIIKQETYQYSDPITEFIYALYVDYDFELAQKKLSQVEIVLKSDFFLASLADEFVECARHLISESYCRIHQVIDIKDLSQRLNLSPEDGEKWIVSLVRETRSDAKIDFNKVIERTKGLYLDSTVMVQSIKTLQTHVASRE